jgi:riboflavin kinase/FMN adenylyltransferase
VLVTRGFAPRIDRPVALTIGNFDGVHIGHQAMLARLVDAARARECGASVLTFEPHPRELFAPAAAPARLTSLREKLELLGAYGVGHVHVQRFSRAFATLSPDDFLDRILVRALGVRWLLVGDDFRFGAQRAGDLALLRRFAGARGFEVETMPSVLLEGTRISSSAVRAALARGDLAHARKLLGRAYSISGRVVHGDKLGRALGFATANVQLKHNRPPLAGIFAVRVRGVTERRCQGVASLGVRPTVKADGRPTLEVHLFDYSGDLYRRHLHVEFIEKIRDEEAYPDLATLKAQIARDCDAARAVLAATES